MEQVQMGTLRYQLFGMVSREPFVIYHFSNYTAHALLSCRSHRLSANMVRRLGQGICHTYWECTRTSSLNADSHHWPLHLSYWLGWYSPQ